MCYPEEVHNPTSIADRLRLIEQDLERPAYEVAAWPTPSEPATLTRRRFLRRPVQVPNPTAWSWSAFRVIRATGSRILLREGTAVDRDSADRAASNYVVETIRRRANERKTPQQIVRLPGYMSRTIEAD